MAIKKREFGNRVKIKPETFPSRASGRFVIKPVEMCKLAQYFPSLTYTAYRIFDVLCSYYNDYKKISFPSHGTVMVEAAIRDRKAYFAALNQLELFDLAKRIKKRHNKSGKMWIVFELPRMRRCLDDKAALKEFKEKNKIDDEEIDAEEFSDSEDDDDEYDDGR